MKDFKLYIGTKIIKAFPQVGVNGTEGYGVEYPDGYISWSPKSTFEEAYREISASEIELIKE